MDTMMDYDDPSDKSLIDDYLRPKISGKQRVTGGCVHDADVYSDHPYNLTLQHEPAAVAGGRTTWYFFSPARYVGRKNAAARSWTVVGADGRKKGTWNPRRTKRVVEGSDGGYFRTLTYQETTPAGGIVRPGWMMVEYGVAEDHGGGEVVLCKVYRSSPNGAGSDGKRKADAVEPPEAPTSARRRQEMDDDMAFAQSLESELLCYFGIENDSPGGEHASPDQRDQPDSDMPPCSARPEEAAATREQPSRRGSAADDDDDDVMEISVEEFLCSSVAPTAQPENAAAASTSSPHGQSTDSSTLSALIDDVSDDEVLACPPMDDEYVERITSEALVQFDPSFIEEFISDD